MKRGDDVFLLTLIDLLLQLLFVGLLVSAADAALREKPAEQIVLAPETVARLDSIAKAQGFANVDSLTDELTRLAPVRELRRLAGISSSAGGVDSLKSLVEKAQRGSGLPPCIYRIVGTKQEPVLVARVTAWDDSVRIESIGDSLSRLLREKGRGSVPNHSMMLKEFRRSFEVLVRSDCRYRVALDERTDYKRARDTVAIVFSLSR